MIAHDNLRLSFSFVFLIVSALTILISTIWVEREDVPGITSRLAVARAVARLCRGARGQQAIHRVDVAAIEIQMHGDRPAREALELVERVLARLVVLQLLPCLRRRRRCTELGQELFLVSRSTRSRKLLRVTTMEEGARAARAAHDRQAAVMPRVPHEALRRRAEVTVTEEVLAARGHSRALCGDRL